MAFLEGPALLASQIREVELPFNLSRLSMAIKTSGKSIIVHDSSMWPFHMRRLRVVLDRSSQARSNNFFFNWGRKLYSGPGFRTVSELWSDQNPEVSNSLGYQFPSKVLSGGLMLSMSGSAQ
eukprot:328341-Amphidinium_carterae.1